MWVLHWFIFLGYVRHIPTLFAQSVTEIVSQSQVLDDRLKTLSNSPNFSLNICQTKSSPVLCIVRWTCQTVLTFCPTFRPAWCLNGFWRLSKDLSFIIWMSMWRTWQEPDTIKTVEMLCHCSDNVCFESNFTQHWINTKICFRHCRMAMSNTPNIWLNKFWVHVGWNVGIVQQGLNWRYS